MLGPDLLVEAEMLFNRGNALKGVIDFFLEAGDILDHLRQAAWPREAEAAGDHAHGRCT
jgi:hypothetical protein